jgi:hypothetical protein
MFNLITPLATTPFNDPKTGMVSRDWYLFLATLTQALGGPSVVPGGDIFSDPSISQVLVQQTFEDIDIPSDVTQPVTQDFTFNDITQPLTINLSDIPALPYVPTSPPVTKTSDFTVGSSDVWIINNKAGSICTVTLPNAVSFSGRNLHIKNNQAFAVVSASANVVQVAGGAAGTAILSAVIGDTVTLVSDGANWLIMEYTPNNILLLE